LLTQARAPASVEDDRKSIPEPAERHVSADFDFFMSGLVGPAVKTANVPGGVVRLLRSPLEAKNVSELDEVPDSSWFTNRNFWSPSSADKFREGPARAEHAPDSGPWTVTKCKTDGVMPGIQIRDQKKDVFLLKFDPQGHLELSTAADVIASRFLYAAGYNVPENFIVTFDEHILVPSPDLVCKGADDEKLRSGGLAKLLEKVPRTPQGQLRAMASKFIAGKIKGPFSYSGIRKDDPNDRIPHEHRRELRGLRMIQAFLNNPDVKQLNTLDTYVEEDGQTFLKHYLIDFGDSLGSLSVRPKQPGDADHYLIDPVDLAKTTFTLRRNRRRNNSTTEYPSIGYIEGVTFDPMSWRQNWPNRAFDNMTKRDGYWAAKIVASFTNEQIEAAVRAGEYSDPDAERTLIQVVEERRDRVADYWFRRVAPLDRFRFTSQGLRFDDLAIQMNLNNPVDVKYEVLIKGQNVTSVSPTGYQTVVPMTATESPLKVHIRRISGSGRPLELDVIVGLVEGEPTVVGIQR
jgi:hypothetical protein